MAKKIIYEDWQKDFIYLAFFDFQLKEIAKQIGIADYNLRKFARENYLYRPDKVIIGNTFGKLTVIDFGPKDKDKKTWKCQCSCDNKSILFVHTGSLLSGHTSSCGCGRLEAIDHGFEFVPGWYFGRLKRNAKKRNINFDIRIEDINEKLIAQNFKCALTNLPVEFHKTEIRNNMTKTTASVDRIDNDKGYSKDNIQILHTDVNILKNVYPQNYFIKLCYLIGKNFNEKLDCELGENFLRWHEKGGLFKKSWKINNEKSDG